MTQEQFIVKVLSIAKIGLKYSRDDYALENYAELEKLGLEMLNSISDNLISENIFVADLYPTPNLSVRVMIVNDENQVLFVKEKVEEKWSLPGGWCDLFISPRANGSKEVFEEVGLKIETDKMLALFNRELYRKPKTILSDYVIYFFAKMPKDQKINIGFEVSDAKFYNIAKVLDLSTNNTKKELAIAWDVYVNNKNPWVDWREILKWKLMLVLCLVEKVLNMK